MSFRKFQLDSKIIESLKTLEYKVPTQVQEEVIPAVLNGKDVIAFEKTGKGKTAAFSIPLCEKVNWEINSPQVLVVAPTRELAIQISQEIEQIGKNKRLRAQVLYGKQSFEKEKLNLKQKCHFIVATLGRLKDHVERGTIDLSNVEYLVLDEFDELMQSGFINDLNFVMDNLLNVKQKIFVSATVPANINEIIEKYLAEPYVYDYRNYEEKEEFKLSQKYLLLDDISMDNKIAALKKVIAQEGAYKSIVFGNTQVCVESLYDKLKPEIGSLFKIHGDMSQRDRIKALRNFSLHKKSIIISTNVVARGIHIDDVDLVINFEVPFEKEKYTHRIGRTARAGNEGLAVTFVGNSELEGFMKKTDFDESIEKYDLSNAENKGFYSSFIMSSKNRIVLQPKNEDIIKLYLRGGKNKKLRAVDIVGTICSVEGVSSDDIGVIKIELDYTTVDILNGKGFIVLNALKDKNIKGKRIKVEIAKR
ncbi:MAG: DEAD/DEAH box helicase [Proteocatella sp.]